MSQDEQGKAVEDEEVKRLLAEFEASQAQEGDFYRQLGLDPARVRTEIAEVLSPMMDLAAEQLRQEEAEARRQAQGPVAPKARKPRMMI